MLVEIRWASWSYLKQIFFCGKKKNHVHTKVMCRGYIFNPCKIFIFTQWYSTGGFYIWYDINYLIRSKLLKQVGIFKQSWCISYQRDVQRLYLKSNSDISSYLQLSGYIKCKHSINITYTHTYTHTHTHTHVLILILILMGVGVGVLMGRGDNLEHEEQLKKLNCLH